MRYSDEIQAICQQNNLKALEVFIQQQQEADPDYSPPLRALLRAATDWEADKIAAYCLENGQTVPDGVMTSVVVNNSFAVYRLLVERKAVDINYYVPWYGDILGTFAYSDKIEWVKFCLEHGADPNENLIGDGLRALACAASTGNIEMVDLMLQHGARLKGSYALVAAAMDGHLEMVKHLLSIGADIDEIGIEGPAGDEGYEFMGSPLHHAATKGYTEMAIFLIDAEANIHLKDLMGRTAEDLALEKNHTEILNTLRRKMGPVQE
ncbi:ankyrin repeat domain-containing protein [Aspergillus lucknowensis]|uniref:Ankyrin repeat-containing domain protein n=1 Tax=Aspergillus lucknowensis TaxID=176173 RepID=A0ABR4LM14_9EURO